MRTDLTTEIDAALAGRNAGSRGYWEVARSGNGNMMTDLLAEDGVDYDELEGLGEGVEEMSEGEDSGRSTILPYRMPKPSEQAPYAPRPGNTWIRRRIPMNSRRPGGKKLLRLRWAQLSQPRYEALVQKGLIKQSAGNPRAMDGMGFVDISGDLIRGLAYGAVAVLGYQWLKRKGIIKLGGA